MIWQFRQLLITIIIIIIIYSDRLRAEKVLFEGVRVGSNGQKRTDATRVPIREQCSYIICAETKCFFLTFLCLFWKIDISTHCNWAESNEGFLTCRALLHCIKRRNESYSPKFFWHIIWRWPLKWPPEPLIGLCQISTKKSKHIDEFHY